MYTTLNRHKRYNAETGTEKHEIEVNLRRSAKPLSCLLNKPVAVVLIDDLASIDAG